MEVAYVKRLKQVEQETAGLKKLLAERDLEVEVMKEIAAKMVSVSARNGVSRRPVRDPIRRQGCLLNRS